MPTVQVGEKKAWRNTFPPTPQKGDKAWGYSLEVPNLKVCYLEYDGSRWVLFWFNADKGE